MKKKKITIFILIVSLLFFFGTIGNIIIINTINKLSEKNTTEFTATITKVVTKGTGNDEYGIIYTQEYDDKLNVYNINEITNKKDFTELQSGQTVYFRIENVWLEKFNEINFIHIVSLRTSEKEIFSLSNYNNLMINQRTSATIAGIIVCILLFLISVYCTLILNGFNIFKKLRKK